MFFSISNQEFDERFVKFICVDGFYVSLDEGWSKELHNNKTVLYKGYCDEQPMEKTVQELTRNHMPCYNGNFCAIVIGDNRAVVTHNINRSFPLVHNECTVTNFPADDMLDQKNIWSDTIAVIGDNIVELKKFDNLYKDNNFSQELSVGECIEQIAGLLKSKTEQLDRFNLPINVFLSGGVDTMIAYALIRKHFTSDYSYNLIAYEHCDLTPFVLKNYQKIKEKYWSYQQIHHWKSPTVLSSGAFGDEMFMHNPILVALWCAWHDYNILEILENTTYCYHKKYFLNRENQQIFLEYWNNRKKIQRCPKDYIEREIYNNVTNNYQHWHFEKTLTWTPLNDVRILRIILQLSPPDLLQQILHGSIERAIIAQFNADLNNYISDNRNFDQYHKLINYSEYKKSLNIN